jgi:carbon monoxide dehydrogenase subunit G
MKLAGDYTFGAGTQEVWDALMDPAVLAAVMPGCEKLELVDGSYLGEINVKVGPIQGKFSGKVDLSDMVEPKSYKMVVDGKGSTGFVKATATIALEPAGTGTKVTYDADAQVGGKIASVGQRLVETSAKAIVKQSLEGLAENIKIRSEAYRAHTAAAAVPAPVVVDPPKPVVQEAEPVVEAVADAVKAMPEVVMPTELARPEPAAPQPTLAAVAAPVIEYKKADAGKLAGAVAKEVTKTLAPILLVVAVAIALVIYLIVR